MDLISAAGRIISLIEAGIKISDQLKEIAHSEHKLPNDVETLHSNAQQLLETMEALQRDAGNLANDAKIAQLADKSKNISAKVVSIMDRINPDWRQKRYTPAALWRSYLKQKDVQLMQEDFLNLREHMKFALLKIVCQSSSEAKSQYEELRSKVDLGDEHIVSIQGSVHDLGQRLDVVQESIYNLGKQVGAASLVDEEFQIRAIQLLTLERKVATILARLMRGFQDKDSKADSIAEADNGTFEWLLQGSEYREQYPNDLNEEERLAYSSCDPDMLARHVEASNNFRSFLKEPSGAFLILGKPGSGKSTLMKYLMHNSSVSHDLEQWATTTNRTLIRAIFFFSVTQGNGALSSEESLYRSLLYQILRQCPALVDDLLPAEADVSPSIPIPLGTVQDAIRRLFTRSKTVQNYCFCIFIDGLDEFRLNTSDSRHEMEQNNYDISELMRRLMGWCEDKGGNSPVNIKMIFSSRIIPILDSQFPSQKKVVLHVHTKRDMFHSALSHFKSHPEAILDDYIELSKMICSQAHGVFLWARFVIKDILEAYIDGVDPSTFRDRIEKTPVDIFNLFAKILQRVKETDRGASAMILRLAAFQPGGFRLNTLACTWLDKLGNVDFPFHAPAKLYSAEETEKLHGRAVQRLAALTHGLLEPQYAAIRLGRRDTVESRVFFQSEIVFIHRTAQDFIRTLLARDIKDAKDEILPWLYYNDDVCEDNWSRCWRSNLYARIFIAEMRFGVARNDDHGKPHADLWDFGFWGNSTEQVQLSEFKSLYAFSQFSQRYKRFHTRAKGLNIHFMHQSFTSSQVSISKFRRFSLGRAILEGEDVSAAIQGRHLSRRLSCQLALNYILSEIYIKKKCPDVLHLNGLKWLFEKKMVCAIDRIPVWHPGSISHVIDEVKRERNADRGHVDDDCSCGVLGESFVEKYGRLVQIWFIFLHVFATKALSVGNLTDRPVLENYCRMLELWLQYGGATDAIILITTKAKYVVNEHETDNIFYIEIEQLLQVIREPLNFDNLQHLLAARRKSWTPWITDWILWAWNYSYHRLNTSDGSINPIRRRYRRLSNLGLSEVNWRVYGVASDDDVLTGEYWYQLA